MDIKIRYLDTGLVEIKVTEVGDWIDLRSVETVCLYKKVTEVGDWIDLRTGKTVCLYKGEKALLRLGVAMKLPDGYEAIVAPRSSTFKNYGLIWNRYYCQTNSTYEMR